MIVLFLENVMVKKENGTFIVKTPLLKYLKYGKDNMKVGSAKSNKPESDHY